MSVTRRAVFFNNIRPDLKTHDSYPFDNDERLWKVVAIIDEEIAYAMYCQPIKSLGYWKVGDEVYRVALFREFIREFMNKGLRVVQAFGDNVVAITKHDDSWMIVTADAKKFNELWVARQSVMKIKYEHPTHYIPYPIL